jgi:hypothetical protein
MTEISHQAITTGIAGALSKIGASQKAVVDAAAAGYATPPGTPAQPAPSTDVAPKGPVR